MGWFSHITKHIKKAFSTPVEVVKEASDIVKENDDYFGSGVNTMFF